MNYSNYEKRLPDSSDIQYSIHSPSIIGATCAFDAKIYKIVDSFLAVSSCSARIKKKFQLFYFCFQLPSLLVEIT